MSYNRIGVHLTVTNGIKKRYVTQGDFLFTNRRVLSIFILLSTTCTHLVDKIRSITYKTLNYLPIKLPNQAEESLTKS